MTTVIHLYGRRDCHLCAEMQDALRDFAGQAELLVFDVDADPALVRRYGARVPVLTLADGTEVCHYFMDEAALRQHLRTA